MSTILQIVDAFDKRQFTKVEEYLAKIKNKTQDSFVSDIPFVSNKDKKQQDIDAAFPLLYDVGSGPMSDGLKALEAMALAISGTSIEGIRMFNKYPMVYQPYDMKHADNDFSLVIVLENLKMLNYYNLALTVAPNECLKLKNLCLKISKRIKSGTFLAEDFNNEVIRLCKSVIRAGLNYKRVI